MCMKLTPRLSQQFCVPIRSSTVVARSLKAVLFGVYDNIHEAVWMPRPTVLHIPVTGRSVLTQPLQWSRQTTAKEHGISLQGFSWPCYTTDQSSSIRHFLVHQSSALPFVFHIHRTSSRRLRAWTDLLRDSRLSRAKDQTPFFTCSGKHSCLSAKL